jgi:hypothetical protein
MIFINAFMKLNLMFYVNIWIQFYISIYYDGIAENSFYSKEIDEYILKLEQITQ